MVDDPDRRLSFISIVVPMYNEEKVIDSFFEEIGAYLTTLQCRHEIVCVNDGSGDGTMERLLARRAGDAAVKIVDLARNFGKENALTAGLDHCRGDVVVSIDADLQDPPELIDDFIAKWRQGFDVVYGVRSKRLGEAASRKALAHLFYRVFNLLTEQRIPIDTGDFRLMDRRVVEALGLLPEHNRFMKGVSSWVGFRQVGLPFVRKPRAAGVSKWNLWRLWNFAIDGIASFSAMPLKVWSYFGFVVSVLAFSYAAFLIVRTLVFGVDVPGYASLMVVVLFLGGIQLITLGIIGEYLGRVYDEAKRRPLYIVNRLYGLDRDQTEND